jgi:5'-deoxynucleotidase YfbR-like HD superfamily hydrolase
VTDWNKWPLFIMEGGSVARFHTRPMLRPCSDAEHMWGVAMMCWRLADGNPSRDLLMAALTHDLGEQGASDVSARTKKALNIERLLQDYEDGIRSAWGVMVEHLGPDDARLLNLADRLECMLYLCKERFMGNSYAELPYQKTLAAARELVTAARPGEVLLLGSIQRIWEKACTGAGPAFDVHEEVSLKSR